ncbi:MAG: rRNA-intervening sequence protein [Verrucomicrobiota bacterium]|jgi:hypothetical protein
MKIETAKDLDVYKSADRLAMEIFELTKTFPSEEKYAWTSQISILCRVAPRLDECSAD